ncbi:MAG TPA: CPBP family intramembrane glutamic endopeptidase [Pyrinomonadaceae bacterium]|nr:CPBP family intramembrane glutamic endopeptidase [Pyrinomonadaceae bacterium]
MQVILEWLKRHLWAAFLLHQSLLFLLAISFLSSIRRITGRTIHLGRDPIGFIDGAALIVLSLGVIFLTNWFYHLLKGKDAEPLGIGFSPRRLLDLTVGLIIGAAFVIAPWISAISRGTATIADRIDAHFDSFSVVRILAIAFFLLLLQAIMEETANRAFPLRLWEHRSLIFRLIVPSVFFALIHLADEQFGFERLAVLLMAGVIQSLAYLLTGNIWFTSGLHAGANIASFSITGLWHAGAIVSVAGQPAIPNFVTILIMLVLLSLAFVSKQRFIKNEN